MMEMPPLPDAGLIYMGLTGNPEHAYSGAQMVAYGESCARMAREEERERCIQAAEGCARCHPEDVEMIVAVIRKD